MDWELMGLAALVGLIGSKMLHGVVQKVRVRRQAGIKNPAFLCPQVAQQMKDMRAEQEQHMRAIQGQLHDLARFLEEMNGK